MLLRGTWDAVGTQSLLLASLTPKAALALAFAAAAKNEKAQATKAWVFLMLEQVQKSRFEKYQAQQPQLQD